MTHLCHLFVFSKEFLKPNQILKHIFYLKCNTQTTFLDATQNNFPCAFVFKFTVKPGALLPSYQRPCKHFQYSSSIIYENKQRVLYQIGLIYLHHSQQWASSHQKISGFGNIPYNGFPCLIEFDSTWQYYFLKLALRWYPHCVSRN